MPLQPPDILSQEWEDWGWNSVRRDVFQLVAWGYQLTETEIRQRELEEDITGLIRKGIRAKLDEELPARFCFYFPANEDPVDDHSTFGKDRPRVDILIECSVNCPRKRYRLEAKRCARKKYNSRYTIGWYAGGITAYVERLYARDSEEAGLLGLFQSDTSTYWKAELSTKLKEDETLSCLASLKNVYLIPDLLDMAESLHQRNDGSEITLYHLFLDCTQDPKQAWP